MGFTRPYLEAANHGFADVKDTIEYKAEVPVGARIVIESGLLKVGRSSITALHVMRDADTGETAATSEKITVYFDFATRQSAPIPDDMRPRWRPSWSSGRTRGPASPSLWRLVELGCESRMAVMSGGLVR